MKRQPVTIAGISYPTKKALTEALRKILYGYVPEATIEPDDATILAEVLNLHPDKGKKIGSGVKRFFVRINATYGNNRGFWLERLDGTETDWSFVECLSPSSNLKKVKSALRAAIVDQVLAHKTTFFGRPAPKVCPFTGSHLTPSNSHVDHASPLTFDRLVDLWSESRGLDLSKLQVEEHGDGDQADILVDRDLARDWQDYHRAEAVLRVISIEGNLSHARRDKEAI